MTKRVLWLAVLAAIAAMGGTAVSAGEIAPLPYYNLNPYDDLAIGPGIVMQGEGYRMDAAVGYSIAQREGRARARYRRDFGLGGRFGYDLYAFHEVQARSDLVPLFQTGFYEGRTGGAASLIYHFGGSDFATLSVISDKIWALPPRTNLRPTVSDRIYAARLGYQRDTRDDVMNPRSGGRVALGVTQAVRAWGSTRAYLSSFATCIGYRGVGESGAFAWRAHAAGTAGTPPEQRQIWLPGEGVRGYDFITSNGDLAAVVNAEIRLPMVARENIHLGPLGTVVRLQVTGFADAGTVHDAANAWKVRGGVGVGVRAPVVAFDKLPLILRVDVAQGLTSGAGLKGYLTLTAPELF